MTQNVQELINKIKREGVEEAQQKAQEILSAAEQKAKGILEKAQAQAQDIVAQAEQEAQKNSRAMHVSLAQASRDMILKLKKEIQDILYQVVSREIRQAMTTEVIVDLVRAMAKKSPEAGEITVLVNEKDLERLRSGFLARLQQEIKKPITFLPDEQITGGFTISFDNNKSCFDFTEASLARYLSGYLKGQISTLFKETSQS